MEYECNSSKKRIACFNHEIRVFDSGGNCHISKSSLNPGQKNGLMGEKFLQEEGSQRQKGS